MALQPEDESKTGTLPDPELNPLLNPLLAANMGRWAEVYFTNPPEKASASGGRVAPGVGEKPAARAAFQCASRKRFRTGGKKRGGSLVAPVLRSH